MTKWLLIAILIVGLIGINAYAQPGQGQNPQPGQGYGGGQGGPGGGQGMGPGGGQGGPGGGQGMGPGGGMGMGPGGGQGMGPGFPGGPQGRPEPAVECNSNGMFMLQGNAVIKLDPKTLEKKGEIKLTDTKNEGRNNGQGMPPMGPQSMGKMLIAGSNLLLVTGDKFISIDTASFKIKLETELPAFTMNNGSGQPQLKQQGPNQGDRKGMQQPMQQMQMMSPMPDLKLNGNILYILRGPQIIALDLSSGKVTGEKKMNMGQPPQMPPQPMQDNPPR